MIFKNFQRRFYGALWDDVRREEGHFEAARIGRMPLMECPHFRAGHQQNLGPLSVI